MATTQEYIEYVCEQISDIGEIRYKKMFGEYMVYVNNKPILLVCDGVVYVKELDVISDLMCDANRGIPYKGAKEHYILDIDNISLSKDVIMELEKVTPIPKPRRKK